MTTISLEEAKSRLEEYLARAQAGEEFVVHDAQGRPAARLTAAEEPDATPKKRVPGIWEGKLVIPDDFNVPDEELISLFYDSPLTSEPLPE